MRSSNHDRPNVLFLCTGNSCRSQMAEGWARHYLGKHADFYSAGTEQHGLNPQAVAAMANAGVDISHHKSKTLKSFGSLSFDFIVTVCSDADEKCPVLPGTSVSHWGFDDPPRLAQQVQSPAEQAEIYQRVCRDIELFVCENLPKIIGLDPK